MPTDRVKCSGCGFAALLFRTEESVKLIIDSAKQTQVCHHLRQEPQTQVRRLAPLDCLAFRETVQTLASNSKRDTQTLAKDAESEGSETARAPAVKVADEEVVRSRKSHEAKIAEAGAGSPKARSARRPSKKVAGRRSARPSPVIGAAEAPTVS
jgi:hypothetical protein